jgi:hypothetical protein
MNLIPKLIDIMTSDGLETDEAYDKSVKSAKEIVKNYIKKYNFYMHEMRVKNESENENDINKLCILTLFANDIWDLIDVKYKETPIIKNQYRINVIGKLYNRGIQAIHENICLFQNGYGLTTFLNWRMIYECYVLSKYIWASGEDEAKRFQDYAYAQSNKLNPQSVKNKVYLDGKYDMTFSKNYGWVTKTKDKQRTFNSIRSTIDENNYFDYYLFTSNYVHASPYSLEKIVFGDEETNNTNTIGPIIKYLTPAIKMNIDIGNLEKRHNNSSLTSLAFGSS